MHHFFPDDYGRSLSTLLTLAAGGRLEEVQRTVDRIAAAEDPQARDRLWVEAWTDLAAALRRRAAADLEAGRDLSAAAKLDRAAVYLLTAERHDRREPAVRRALYEEHLAVFADAARLSGSTLQATTVPFEGGELPALLLPAAAPGPAPCLVLLNGLDSTKEILFSLVRDRFTRRGVAVLFVDQPGSGGALRLHGQTIRVDSEAVLTASIDALAARPDIDAERIGVGGISLGGYFAPRAAAFEQRAAFCLVWGAIWDTLACFANALSGSALSIDMEATYEVAGVRDREELLALVRQMTLEGGVAEKVTCDTLVVHGRNDRQAPVWVAERTHERFTSARTRQLRIMEPDEGGAEHVQVDLPDDAIDLMADWVAEVTGAARSEEGVYRGPTVRRVPGPATSR